MDTGCAPGKPDLKWTGIRVWRQSRHRLTKACHTIMAFSSQKPHHMATLISPQRAPVIWRWDFYHMTKSSCHITMALSSQGALLHVIGIIISGKPLWHEQLYHHRYYYRLARWSTVAFLLSSVFLNNRRLQWVKVATGDMNTLSNSTAIFRRCIQLKWAGVKLKRRKPELSLLRTQIQPSG